MLKPGVSSRLIFFFFHSAAAMAVEIVILRCDLFVIEIGNGVALIDAQEAVGGAGGVQQTRR